ncbi:MAG: hypothetical protein ACKVOA_03765 [Methylophilaceae bacterium]
MSLRDERLQQALQHAPDRDVTPNAARRRAVLDYAAKAVHKKSFSLSGLWQHMTGWPLAGLSSAMVALLVLVVFWDKPSAPPSFDVAATRQVAQAPAPQIQSEPAARHETAPVLAGLAHAPMAKKAELLKQKELPTSLPAKAAVEAATEEMKSEGQLADAQATQQDGNVGKAEGTAVLAERTDNTEKPEADKRMAAAPTMAKAPTEETELLEARQRGISNANADIQAGKLLILALGVPKENALDAATGYRVKYVTGNPHSTALQAEIEAYNQTMRDWHSK